MSVNGEGRSETYNALFMVGATLIEMTKRTDPCVWIVLWRHGTEEASAGQINQRLTLRPPHGGTDGGAVLHAQPAERAAAMHVAAVKNEDM